VVCPLWHGTPAQLLGILESKLPWRLPDDERLRCITQLGAQRTPICKRHLQFIDGVAAGVVEGSPTAVRRHDRASRIRVTRTAQALSEEAKKERAVLLKARRDVARDKEELVTGHKDLLNRVTALQEDLARARATYGDLLGDLAVNVNVASQLPFEPVAPEVVAQRDMLSYFYFFRSLPDLEAFVQECDVDLGKMQLAGRTAVYLSLVHLRRATPFKELAYLFNMEPSQVSRAIEKALPQMAKAVKPTLCSREDLQRYIPAGHKALLPSAVLVVDGTYIYTPAPAGGAYQRLSYVGHKKRHAQKVLVLTYPNGQIAMLSKPSGNSSDETMFLELLERAEELRQFLRGGDEVVGDRGLQDAAFKRKIKEILGKNVEMLHPVTKTHGQATVEDANISRRISSFRAGVEQANANLKKATLLTNRFPLQELHRLAHYLDLAAGLVNRIFTPLYAQEDAMELDGRICDEVSAMPVRHEGRPRRTSGKNVRLLRELVTADRDLWLVDKDLPIYSDDSDDIEPALLALAPAKKQRTNPRLDGTRHSSVMVLRC